MSYIDGLFTSLSKTYQYPTHSDKDQPDFVDEKYVLMRTQWDKITDVILGKEQILNHAYKYIPQRQYEVYELYDNRIKDAYLYETAYETLETWVGRVFQRNLIIDEEGIFNDEKLLKDVTGSGISLYEICEEWFRTGLSKGACYLVVDSLRVKEQDSLTLADVPLEELRPRWRLIYPEQVLSIESQKDRLGKETVSRIRVMSEQEGDRDGFKTKIIRYVHEYTPNFIYVYQQLPDNPRYELIDTIEHGLGEVPIVAFRPITVGNTIRVKSPLAGLVDLSLRHFRATSEQCQLLSTGSLPILFMTGIAERQSEKIILQANNVFSTERNDAKLRYVEHSGTSMNALRMHILDLEAKMASYGADFMRQGGYRSATERVLNGQEASSPLKKSAKRFDIALYHAIRLHKKWLGAADSYENTDDARVQVEFIDDFATQDVLNALHQAFTSSAIDRDTYVSELRRRNILSLDVTVDNSRVLEEIIDVQTVPQEGAEQQQSEETSSDSSTEREAQEE